MDERCLCAGGGQCCWTDQIEEAGKDSPSVDTRESELIERVIFLDSEGEECFANSESGESRPNVSPIVDGMSKLADIHLVALHVLQRIFDGGEFNRAAKDEEALQYAVKKFSWQLG